MSARSATGRQRGHRFFPKLSRCHALKPSKFFDSGWKIDFVRTDNGQRFGRRTYTHALFATIVGSVVSVIMAGCVSDQQLTSGAPRELFPDLAVQGDRSAGPEKSKLFVLLPLTGPDTDIGWQLWDAAVLALFDSGRDDVILFPRDTQGGPSGAKAAAIAAVEGGADAVIGPLFSSSVIAAKPILTAHGTRGIALSNNPAVAGTPFFLIGNNPETEVDALTGRLTASGRNRIVLFGPDTPYVRMLRQRLALLDKVGEIKLVDSLLYHNDASYSDIANDVRAITLYNQRKRALREFTAIFSEFWRRYQGSDEPLQHALDRFNKRAETGHVGKAAFAPENKIDRKTWVVSDAEFRDACSELLQIYHQQLKAQKAPSDAMREAIAEFERRETLGQADFDAVLLPMGGNPLLVIAPMFAYYNATQPTVRLVGTDVWEPAALDSPKDLLGSLYVTTTSPRWGTFQSRFEAIFGLQARSFSIDGL